MEHKKKQANKRKMLSCLSSPTILLSFLSPPSSSFLNSSDPLFLSSLPFLLFFVSFPPPLLHFPSSNHLHPLFPFSPLFALFPSPHNNFLPFPSLFPLFYSLQFLFSNENLNRTALLLRFSFDSRG